MKAIKENRAYTIDESQVRAFAADGYDVYDSDGKLVAYGAGKTVPFDKYLKLMGRVEKMAEHIAALEEEIVKLKKGKK
jgi:argonaute-like protein implicated in RNA metabolism and viral defense